MAEQPLRATNIHVPNSACTLWNCSGLVDAFYYLGAPRAAAENVPLTPWDTVRGCQSSVSPCPRLLQAPANLALVWNTSHTRYCQENFPRKRSTWERQWTFFGMPMSLWDRRRTGGSQPEWRSLRTRSQLSGIKGTVKGPGKWAELPRTRRGIMEWHQEWVRAAEEKKSRNCLAWKSPPRPGSPTFPQQCQSHHWPTSTGTK